MRQRVWQIAGLGLVAALAISLGRVSAAQDGGSMRRFPPGIRMTSACASLSGLVIPASDIGLPTSGGVVETAVTVAATEARNVNGDFCKVTGIVKPKHVSSPNLEFEVNLPALWNGRALQMGGGGYDGSLVTGLGLYTLQPANQDTPLKQGYITLGSDGGHKSSQGFDGSFAMDDEALNNFGKQSIKKAHDAAMIVIRKAYARFPEYFFFIGGSQGGHEALDAAARYPEDYNGVVAHYPAYNVTMLHLGSWNAGKALYADGGAGWLDAAHTKLITDAVYAKCDKLDGANDGIISNVAGCNAAFDVKALRCPGGAAGATCLSDAQLKAVAAITSDYKPGYKIAGMDTFPKWALLEGAQFQGASNFGAGPRPSNPVAGDEPLLYRAGDQTIKFILTRNPKFDTMTFDTKKYQTRVEASGTIMDVTDVSLDKFRAKGGKIIMTHGAADDFITPHNSIAYYKRQLAQFGQAKLDSFMRFYVIPGLGHGFGPFNAKTDSLMALTQWVEPSLIISSVEGSRSQPGKAPAGLVAIDGNTGPTAGRTRPLCAYPKWPKLTGPAGTENSAASYTCVTK